MFLYTTLRLRTGQMGYWLKLSLLTFIFEGLFWSLLHYAIFVPFFWIIAGMIWVDRKEKVDVATYCQCAVGPDKGGYF